MPFQAYLPVGFDHSHENRMFEQLSKTLAAGIGSSPEPVYEHCPKGFEFENTIKKMNTSQNKIPIELMSTNPGNGPIIEIGEANFESEVLSWKQPVLVAFSAAWSRPLSNPRVSTGGSCSRV